MNIKKTILIVAVAPVGCLTALWVGIITIASLGALFNLPIAPPAEIREGFNKTNTPATK